MRLVFAGTPEVAVPALDAIAASRHELVGVGAGDDPDELVLGAHAPLCDGLPRAGEIGEKLVVRADRYCILFVDEMHAVRGL